MREAFGFRDGLAQPVIRGLRVDESAGLKQAIRDAGPLYDDSVVAPGEFILGYRNEYDELTYCPNLEGWTGDAKTYWRPLRPQRELPGGPSDRAEGKGV